MDNYIPTPPDIVEAALTAAQVMEGDILLDLGSGDGRILLAAVQRGAMAVGIECDEELAYASRTRGLTVIVGDAWSQVNWLDYSVVVAAVSTHLRDSVVARWQALPHRVGDRLVVIASERFIEVHHAARA